MDFVELHFEKIKHTDIQVGGLEVKSLFYRTKALKTEVALGAIAFIFVCSS